MKNFRPFYLSLIGILSFCLNPIPVIAESSSSGLILLRSPSARSIGMAEAVSSLGGDIEGVTNFHFNPAANALLKHPEISFMGQRGFVDDSFGALSMGLPTSKGAFTLGIIYFTLGDIELINSQGVSSTVNAERDLGVTVNYALLFREQFSIGISGKYFNSKLINRFSASAVAFDAGVQGKFANEEVSVGLSVLNVGTDLEYINSKESLPFTYRLGFSFHPQANGFENMMLGFDVFKEQDKELEKVIGGSYLWSEILRFRIGYKVDQDLGKINGGLGFILGRFDLDYAISEAGSAGQVHSASISMKFGDVDTRGKRNQFNNNRYRYRRK